MSFLDGLFQRTTTDLTVAESDISEPEGSIEVGFVYVVQAQADDVELTLTTSALADVAGKRVGVKVVGALEGDPMNVEIVVPDNQQIQGDDSAIGDSATFPQDEGNYREWLCASDGTWYLLTPPAPAATVPPASTYEDGGEEEISVAGLAGVLATAQKADELVFDTGGAIPLAARPTTGQVLSFDGTNIVGVAASSGTYAQGELFAKPSVADPRDDEFETTTLAAGWKWYSGATTPNKAALSYSAPVADRYQCHTDRRPSWLGLQIVTGVTKYLLKPVSLSTNDCVWARIQGHIQTSSGGGAQAFQLVLVADSGGSPDFNNMLKFGMVGTSDTAFYTQAKKVVAGVTTNIPGSEGDTLVGGISEYLIIDKVNTKYRFIGAGGTKRLWTDASVISFTPAYVGFLVSAESAFADSQIFESDFVRFNAGGFLALPV